MDGTLSIPIGSTINATECVNLSQTTLKSNYVDGSTLQIQSGSPSCSNLTFQKIQITSLPQCVIVDETVSSRGVYSLSFISSPLQCPNPEEETFFSLFQLGRTESIIVIFFIIVGCILFIALFVYFSPLQQHLFPYRDVPEENEQF